MPQFKAAGAFTALATPFSADGSAIDWSAYERLIASQLDGRISGLVPCGTTGEAPTLSEREQVELIAATAKQARGRASVLAGVGTNSTSKAVAKAKAAVEAGADAVMVVMPYYNRPNQQGLIEHVCAVAKVVDVPIVLYNVPARTSVSLNVDTTLAILDRCQNVLAVKDASNNVHYCQELLARAAGRVQVLSGDDALTLALMALGATGVISVTSNVLPALVSQLVELWRSGEHADALALHYRLLPVHSAMFCAPSPVPVKVALHARGVMEDSVRPPLVPATAEESAKVLAALAKIEAS
jgi:4-hydroxy-tetrahydrodipicolinate synthase